MLRYPKNHSLRLLRIATLLILFLIWATAAQAVSNDWRTPQNIDYKKNPPSIATSVIPNILIILDNSSSMGFNAYGDNTNYFDLVENDHYDGEYLDAAQTSFTTSVVADFDDLEENSLGEVHDDESDGLNLGQELVAIRFQQVVIPEGSTIVSAYLKFSAAATSTTGTCNLTITAQDTADADNIPDISTNGALSSLPQTDTSVDWAASTWSKNSLYQTSDLTTLITELIEKNGWAENNSIRFFISGDASCSRIAKSQYTGGSPAKLTVQYIAPDQKSDTRYYGYFNTGWFYKYDTTQKLYILKYKKVGEFDYANNQWNVEDRSGNANTVDAAKVASEELWDGNWLNWLTMRRSDILRKVLIGGDTKGGRDGSGYQILYGQGKTSVDHPHGKSGVNLYTKSFDGNLALVTPFSGYQEYQAGTWVTTDSATFDATFEVDGETFYIQVLKEKEFEEDEFLFYNGGWNLAGVVQEVGERARWGNMWYQRGKYTENADGGWLENPIGTDLNSLVDALEKSEVRTGTPLAETLYTAAHYFSRGEATAVLSTYRPYTNPHDGTITSVTTGGQGDPYYKLDTEDWDNDGDKTDYVPIPCIKSFVLLLTDGNSTRDFKVPSDVRDADGDGGNTSDSCNETENDPAVTCPSPFGGTDFLDDVAFFAHTTDLRPNDANLPGDQTLTLHTVYTFDDNSDARTLIQEACKNGAFEDTDGNNKPNLQEEWDDDGDGIPNTYYEASDGAVLEKKLRKAFELMLQGTSSATATAVTSNSRSGEGAIYQSVFYPQFEDENKNEVAWIGQINALLLDSYGNMREDTDGDGALNMIEDYILDFRTDEDGNPVVDKYKDADGDGSTDGATDTLTASGESLNKIEYLWTSNKWLNETVTDPVTQRSSYDAADENRRYIFTFVDANQTMVDEGSGIKDFVAGNPDWTTLTSEDSYYAYIHTFDNPFDDTPTSQAQVIELSKRVINYIRGQDQDRDTSTVSGVTLNAFRPRQVDFDGDGDLETMRLGDIVNSSPVLVSQPMEKFHLLYSDESYLPFIRIHKNRRHVLYVGANDGMLHAFNGGFYDSENKQYRTLPLKEDGSEDTSFANHPLGAELWGYVPFNLLPHLYWLTKTDYEHVFYMDLMPRVFDAKIYSGTDYDENHATHPNGWATILVAGMRFGGGTIAADMDKTDGAYDSTTDKKLTSAYVIMDITDPENPPKLLAEVTLPQLGFTTCYPGVISNRNGSNNEWYLVFGSGPASESVISGDIGPNNTALEEGISEQQARIYALDLTALTGSSPSVKMRTNENSATLTTYSGPGSNYHLSLLEDYGTVSNPITVDWDLDADTDTVYFGTSFKQSDQWKGKLRRIVINSSDDWDADSTMLDLSDLEQPIMAAPAAGSDENQNRWIFFGTGRFMSVYDKLSTAQQAFYGVKEPWDDVNQVYTYTEVDYDSLYDSTDEEIEDGNFTGFQRLVYAIQDDTVGGWRMDFIDEGEKNLGAAVLLGGTLSFTTYYPSTDICDVDGSWSRLYAINYLTGTPYIEDPFGRTQKGEEDVIIEKAIKLDSGMCSPPTVQIKRGSAAALRTQDSQGNTISTDLDVPLPLHDWRGPWIPDLEVCEDEDANATP